MANSFAAAMAKLAVLGHNTADMVDCSELIPTPPPFANVATFPAGINSNDVEQAVRRSNFQWNCLADR